MNWCERDSNDGIGKKKGKEMDEWYKGDKAFNNRWHRLGNTQGLITNDPIEKERLAQLEEHQSRQGQGAVDLPIPSKPNYFKRPRRKPQHKIPPKVLPFEENLERTNQWLEQTFPYLFDTNGPTKALDVYILRAIKQHYKNYQDMHHKRDQYPHNLLIKAE